MNQNKFYKILVAGLCIIGVFQLFTFSSDIISKNFDSQEFYAAKAHDLNGEFSFCNEPVPSNSEDIKERLDREILKNAYWHSEMIIYLKRAGKFFPIIEPILKKNNIPDDFKYLAVIESGLSNTSSPAGAKGFWQIMEKTGQEYGLEVNDEIDERYHLEKATEAACKYINDSYKKFGSWTLVAASYNMGMSGLGRRMKNQKVNNYYDLLLNSETSRYVFRIIAVKDIMTNPEKYGYHVKKNQLYPVDKYRIVECDTTIADFTEFAIANNSNYKLFRLFNPWLREPYLHNKKRKKYQFQFPVEGYTIYSDYSCYQDTNPTNLMDSLRTVLCSDSSQLPLEDSIPLSPKLEVLKKNTKIEQK